MRCEKCQTTKAVHSVHLEDTTIGTAIGSRPVTFWDGEDRQHTHDPSWSIEYFRCSNGHVFKQATAPKACGAEGCLFAAGVQVAIDKEMLRRFPAKA